MTNKMMTDLEYKQFHDDKYAEIPPDVLERSMVIFDKHLSPADKPKLILAYNADPIYWIAPFHFYWGMSVRNLLRQNGLNDDLLPSGNWDDYYTQCVEHWLGVR